MGRRTVCFFDKPGLKNTSEVASALIERVEEGGIEAIVVASVSGRTAVSIAENLKRRKLGTNLVCVSGPPSWEKYAPQYRFPLISRRERATLEALRVHIVDRVNEPFKPIIFRDWWEKKTLIVPHPQSDLFWMALICVGGHGLRTAVEVVFMAVEAGAIRVGDRVIGAAGTGFGLDSAIVLKACGFDEAVGPDPEKRLKVEEILAMSKQTTWKGYG